MRARDSLIRSLRSARRGRRAGSGDWRRQTDMRSRIMRTDVAVAIISLAIATTGMNRFAAAQDAAGFLAGNTNDCPGCNLAGAQLKRRNLAGANLSGANLSGASFHR